MKSLRRVFLKLLENKDLRQDYHKRSKDLQKENATVEIVDEIEKTVKLGGFRSIQSYILNWNRWDRDECTCAVLPC